MTARAISVATNRAPRVAVAQIGARMHYAVPAAFERAGMLEALYTDLCAEVGWVRAARAMLPESVAPAGLKRLFARTVRDVPREKIVCFSAFGLSRIVQRDRTRTPGELYRRIVEANAAFASLVARRGLGDADTLYAFNGAALELIRAARQRRPSIRVILEQIAAPVAYDEKLLADERARWPGWEPGGAVSSDWQPLADRERAEWALADTIVCGSQYVVDAIAAESGPAEKCVVVPYGVDVSTHVQRSPGESLRALCVATVQLRKGVQYLIEAARALREKNVSIRLVGPIAVSDGAVRELRDASIDVAGSIARDQMPAEYANADAFVLPTLSEGSATVCYEALAHGLPVITTPNAGSVVHDGVEGFIVPIRDPAALADRLATLLVNRQLVREMSDAARVRAKEFTREAYGSRLIDLLHAQPARKGIRC